MWEGGKIWFRKFSTFPAIIGEFQLRVPYSKQQWFSLVLLNCANFTTWMRLFDHFGHIFREKRVWIMFSILSDGLLPNLLNLGLIERNDSLKHSSEETSWGNERKFCGGEVERMRSKEKTRKNFITIDRLRNRDDDIRKKELRSRTIWKFFTLSS